jgi:YHS domain-containing protein
VGAIVWIARSLIFLLLLRIVLSLLFGSARPGPRQTRPGAGPAPAPERVGGELVRDPNCGTYIPKTSAIVQGSGADVKYFCSTKCRDEYDTKRRSSNVEVRTSKLD